MTLCTADRLRSDQGNDLEIEYGDETTDIQTLKFVGVLPKIFKENMCN